MSKARVARLSDYFLPTLKETPAEAQTASHRLMLRAGMIRRSSAGIYSWLPFGHAVLRNVERIVRDEMDAAGCQEILMPAVQPADLWRESGRYDDYGREMLRFTDRHDRDMVFGPTHEEVVTDIFRHTVRSYRDLPKNLYQIQWKFRDELRPRFGVMRGREFLMKDNYSFDLDVAGARRSYNRMFVAYLRTFARLGLKAVPMRADAGPIGGDMSHEFAVLAETGESEVHCDSRLLELGAPGEVDYGADLQPLVDRYTAFYAAADERHDETAFAALPPEHRTRARGIEVGHIFYFGAKYSSALGARVSGPDGEPVDVEMGSYGIGVSRLVGAIVEASHDDAGIVWPESVAPFRVGAINLKAGDAACAEACESLVAGLAAAGVSVLVDDRDERAGVKFATADLIGLPWRIVVGPRSLAQGAVELRSRRSGEVENLPPEAAVARLCG